MDTVHRPTKLVTRGREAGGRLWYGGVLGAEPPSDLIRIGTEYGGWWIPESIAQPGAVCYLAGAGEDITFDLGLHERGCEVVVFDPTPRAIVHVTENGPHDARFRFIAEGWWDEEATLRFYAPARAEWVSHSINNLAGQSEYFEGTVGVPSRYQRELGHTRVDLVKIDIEGAEHRVIRSMLKRGPRPTVLCVEFDHRMPLHAMMRTSLRLRIAGYRLVKREMHNFTFVAASGGEDARVVT